jgi:HK97 family phage portal protein
MGFLDFLNPTRFLDYADSFVPGFEERSSGIVPPPRSATSGVTTNDALSLASVYRSVSIIATAMKQLGIHVYRDDAEVTPTPLVIRQPDIKVTREVWMEQTVNSMALAGNAYWLIGRNGRGETVNLEVLNPFDVMIQTDDYGNALYYVYRGVTQYALSDIQHLSMMRVPGNVYGLGPIQAAQKELLNARDTRDYASVWFTDSGIPNGVLKSDQMLSPDQAAAAKDAWNLTAGAKNGVAVLGNGLNYQPMYLNPRDSMFIESQAWNVQQVARLFGVPANMLLASVDGNSMTYTNMEQEQMAFVRYTLSQYIVEIESALSHLTTRGTMVKINVDSLLRSDTLTRYQAHKLAIESGWMTIDEVRAIEDMPTVGGDFSAVS